MATTVKTDISKSESERCPAAVFLTDRPVYHTPGVACFCCRRHAQMAQQSANPANEIMQHFAHQLAEQLDREIMESCRLVPLK